MLSGDLQPLIKMAVDNERTCRLPDGRSVTLPQLAQMVRGKSPQEAFKELGGYDFGDVIRTLNS